MFDVLKIKNCFNFNIDSISYLVNFKSRKFWVYSKEEYNINDDFANLPINIWDRLVYEDIIDENQEINKKEKDRGYYPIIGTFLMSTICNLQCIYCYAYNKNNILMDIKTAKIAIDFLINNAILRNNKYIMVKFHGVGEPTLNWNTIVETYNYAKNKTKQFNINLKASITTNGIFSKDKRKWLAKNMDQITISMDGFEDIQNKQRPHITLNSYKEVIKTIKDIEASKVTIRTTVTNINVDEIAKWTIFLNEIGVKKVNFEPVSICGKGKESGLEDVNTKLFIEKYIEAKEIEEHCGIEVSYSGIKLDKMAEFHCGAYGSNFVITPNGNISTCYEVVERNESELDKFLVGQVYENKVSINNMRIKELREFSRIKRKECNECFAQYHCAGGCISKRVLIEDQKIANSIKTKCEITKKILYMDFAKFIKNNNYLVGEVYSF